MMKMNQPKLGPTRAQMKFKKFIFLVLVFVIFAHLLALAALHMASALRAPLAKMCKQNH